MTILDRIFCSPELQDDPPVLIDVGAAGGVWPVWDKIAQYSIGVGFEPDGRDIGKLSEAARTFRRWIYCEGLVAPRAEPGERKPFHLTKSPHCSSLLPPRAEPLREWLFADLFEVQKTVSFPAVTLHGALSAHGVERVDWLKCDTQGLDLSIFLSLPEEWRRRTLAVEFEPGLIDAYQGEDKLWRTLQAMEAEPFWVADLQIGWSPRGNAKILMQELGEKLSRAAPGAPVFANLRYLRSLTDAVPLDRRGLLLAWVFADLLGQHTHGLMVAAEGRRRFGGALFAEIAARSKVRLRRAMRWSLLHRVVRKLLPSV